jgi:Fe2+ or Zn2+ uptake regulation protein
VRGVAKTKAKTARELEEALSPEGLKLTRKSLRVIRAFAKNSAEVADSPEAEAIHELVWARLQERR